MEEAPPSPIRPALQTLAALEDGLFMDKLAVHIHDAVNAVTTFNKKATITVEISFAPLTKHMAEPVVTATGEISSKLPQPDPHQTMFFVDADGNPTTTQQRQGGLNFTVATGSTKGAGAP